MIIFFTFPASANESKQESDDVFSQSSESSPADLNKPSDLNKNDDVAIELNENEKGWLEIGGGWLLNTQDIVSQAVQNTAVSIDRYIARDSFDELERNDSYVRLRIVERLGESGRHDSEARVSAKIDLPSSKRKLKLVFDTDPDDFDSLEDKQRDIGIGTDISDKKSENAAVGLALEELLLNNWKMNLGAGVRLRSALDPYGRARFSRYYKFNENWSSRFRETFFYYDSKSWGADSEIDLYRPLDNDRLLHLSLAGQYLDSENNWEWVQGVSVNQRINRNNALEYQVGVSANSNPTLRVSNYWIRSKWQHRLYKDWLYFNVTPEVTFPRGESFSASFQVNLELELFFSRDPDLRNKRIRY